MYREKLDGDVDAERERRICYIIHISLH